MKNIVTCIVAATMLAILGGCAGRGNEKAHEEALTFEQAKAEEPTLMSTDEIIALVKSDTTHKKVVYWFDMLCKPCRQHLQKEIAEFYAQHDTAEWRIYLVAGLNGMHHAVNDVNGNLVEDAAEDIRYFAAEYREHLPEMGFDMKDVYMHYDPACEDKELFEEQYPDGFFTQLANAMFHSDVAFRCEHDGVPKLFIADRGGLLLTDYMVNINKNWDTLDAYYTPNEYYYFDIKDFAHHDTVMGVIMN